MMKASEVYAGIERHIQESGRSCMSVMDNPPFTYTIGNTLVGKPELIVLGLSPETAKDILNAVSCRDIQAVGDGELISLGGQVALKAIHCADWAKGVYSIQAGRYLQTEAYRLVQLLIPDKAGHYPGEPECEEPYAKFPVLN